MRLAEHAVVELAVIEAVDIRVRSSLLHSQSQEARDHQTTKNDRMP
jgi:hypothetical protein